jgi:hypothetical protein
MVLQVCRLLSGPWIGVHDIVVADKSTTIRSGKSTGGNDHFPCYIPEYQGNDPQPVLREFSRSIAAFSRWDCNENHLVNQGKSDPRIVLWPCTLEV